MTLNFMTHVGDATRRESFPFRSWATANHFDYWPVALPVFHLTESAAEAFFIRPFLHDAFTTVDPAGFAVNGKHRLDVQVRCGDFRIDAVVTAGAFKLAIEIDGLVFHARKKEQVAADYLRQRRIVAMGYAVIRFTAPEVFADAWECWAQVRAILAARGDG